jgi:hypothetical protein
MLGVRVEAKLEEPQPHRKRVRKPSTYTNVLSHTKKSSSISSNSQRGCQERAELKKLAAALRAAARIGLLSKRDLLESNVK